MLLLNLFQQRLEYKWAAAEEDGVVLEKYLKGFPRYLSVEEEVFVMQDKEDGGGSGPEVLEIPALQSGGYQVSVCLRRNSYLVLLPRSGGRARCGHLGCCKHGCIPRGHRLVLVPSSTVECGWRLPGRAARGEASGRERQTAAIVRRYLCHSASQQVPHQA